MPIYKNLIISYVLTVQIIFSVCLYALVLNLSCSPLFPSPQLKDTFYLWYQQCPREDATPLLPCPSISIVLFYYVYNTFHSLSLSFTLFLPKLITLDMRPLYLVLTFTYLSLSHFLPSWYCHSDCSALSSSLWMFHYLTFSVFLSLSFFPSISVFLFLSFILFSFHSLSLFYSFILLSFSCDAK